MTTQRATSVLQWRERHPRPALLDPKGVDPKCLPGSGYQVICRVCLLAVSFFKNTA